MAVYVDSMRAPFRGMIMCHMIATDVEELHLMAERLGLRREWFQSKDVPHYDISLTKRRQAIRYGAIEIERSQVARLIQYWWSILANAKRQREGLPLKRVREFLP